MTTLPSSSILVAGDSLMAGQIEMTTPAQWLQQGWAHHQKKQLNLAEEFYRKALEIDPQNANAF